jgi:chemotaxis protein histidine kinase CheA
MSNYAPWNGTGNGVTTTFSIPWPYLEEEDVIVEVDGEEVSFSFPTSSQVLISPAPANGAAIRISRLTSGEVEVNHSAGRIRSDDLNYGYKQALFRADEAADDLSSDLAAAAASATAAAASAAAAAASETAAELAETNAETAEANAETAETNAETAATNAAASASTASTAATTATTKAAEAATSATNAATSATNAATSATAAATAETNAETAEANAETAQAAAEAAQAAAEAAASAFPTGGTTGQALTKDSNADFDAEWSTIDKTWVGLSNVDNTSDADKPISTATQAALDAKLDDSQKGAAGGLAELDGSGFVPLAQIPATVMSNSFAVADEAAMLALSANVGDVAIRADENKTYILNQTPATDVNNWLWLKTPTDAVLSVAGKTGAVTLAPADIDFSATDRLLGRSTSGAGDGEEITCTAAGRALLDDASASDQRTTLSAASRTQTDFLSVLIAIPEDKTYRLATKLPYGITITEVTSDCESGTCTATVKIDGVALGGTANSVSTTEQSQSHASSNVAAAGTDLELTVSSNSACEGLSLMIKFTRTLD